MEAGKRSLDTIFNKGRLIEVPFFQRSYVWEEENWERFLEDIYNISSHQKEYFMGSIILKAQEVSSGERIGDKRILVDGQQRLTTIILFFKAWSEANNNNEIMETFLNRHKEIILKHNHNDVQIFEAILSGSLTKEDRSTYKSSNIIKCYDYFIKKQNLLQDINVDTILNNLYFVGIDLSKEEDEQQIFDTINSLGVSLSTAELLKNELFQRKDESLYNRSWKSIFEKDDEAIFYWERSLTSGRSFRSNIDIFLQSFLLIQSEAKEKYIGIENLYSNYKLFLKESGGVNEEFINELMSYAKIYQEYISPNLLDEDIDFSNAIERLNIVIFGLNITTAIPYILYVLKNCPDELERNNIFTTIETYLIRRSICKETTKNYNNIFSSFVRNKILRCDDLKKRFQQMEDTANNMAMDSDLKTAFHESKLSNQHAKIILYLIEKFLHTKKDSTTPLAANEYSLEHIMPKKWRNQWPLAKTHTDSERDKILMTLGNLTIITSSLNSAIRDASWTTKKNGNKKKNGLIEHSKSIKIMEKYLEDEVWDEKSIKGRANDLLCHAIKLWSIN